MGYKTRVSVDNIEVQNNGSWNNLSVFCSQIEASNIAPVKDNLIRVLEKLKNNQICLGVRHL